MKNNEIREKLQLIFRGSLSDSELNKLLEIIEKEDIDISGIRDIHSLSDLIGADIQIKDSWRMDSRFYGMLEKEDSKRAPSVRHIPAAVLRIAAGIALFIMGWFGSQLLDLTKDKQLVSELTNEISGLKETLVLTKFQQNSPSERIQAVAMVGEMESPDAEIINGLLFILSNDPNDNVRLLALETLSDYSDNQTVLEGIIRTIEFQDSPLVQLRMARMMVDLEEKRAVPGFRKILEDLTLDYNVRTKLTETVEVLL